MKKIIIALMLFMMLVSSAMADHWHGPRYYHPYPYYRPYYHDHFVAGVVTGAVIGTMVVQPRPVYVAPPPVQYVRQFDPNCGCWVLVAVPVYNGY